jgi:hypothetical protein
MMSPSVNASINRDMGQLFGLSGETLEDYVGICQASVENQELAWFLYMPQVYTSLGIPLEEALVKLEKLLLGDQKYVNLMPVEQQFLEATPFLRRAREMLLPAQAAVTPFHNLGLPKPYTLRFAVQAHLATITDILSVQSGILTSSVDNTIHKVRFDGSRPRILTTTPSPVRALCSMNNTLFASMSQDNELYANRMTGPPVDAEGPLTNANPMVTKYYSLQALGDQFIACLMADRIVEIWRRGSLWTTLPTEHVLTMTLLPNRHLVAVSVRSDDSLSLDEWTPEDIRRSEGDRAPSRSTCIAPIADAVRRVPFLMAAVGNAHIALVCEETPSELHIVSLESGMIRHTCDMSHPICSLAFYADREELFAGNKAGLLLIWRMTELVQRTHVPEWTAFSVSKAPITALKPLHGNALACGDHYGRLHVIDLH